jgi:hypothetical protein
LRDYDQSFGIAEVCGVDNFRTPNEEVQVKQEQA